MQISDASNPVEKMLPADLRQQIEQSRQERLLESFRDMQGDIGIFGGSFDPPHLAHVEIIRVVQANRHFDSLVFMPAWQNPLKQRETGASPEQRMDMLLLALADEEAPFQVSAIELQRPERSFTVDTLRQITQECSENARLHMVIGSENFDTLKDWKDINGIFRLTENIIPVSRSASSLEILDSTHGQLGDDLIANLEANFIGIKPIDISSTEVRNRLARGESTEGLVDERVLKYIQSTGLYQ